MATKKDFVPAAEALKNVKRWTAEDQFVWMSCVNAIADSFAAGNHRFVGEQFRNACGYYDGFEPTTTMQPVETS